MKIVIAIDKDYRAQLEAFVKTANEEMSLEKAEAKTVEKVSANLTKLTGELEQLEKNFDGTDMEMLEKLTSKKQQRDLMASKVAEFTEDGKVAMARHATWHKLMLAMNTCFRIYYHSFAAKMKEEIEAVIFPLLKDDNYRAVTLSQIVDQTHMLTHANWWAQQMSQAGDPRGCVIKLVSVFEIILAGGVIWTFNAEPKSLTPSISERLTALTPAYEAFNKTTPLAEGKTKSRANVVRAKSHAEKRAEKHARRHH
jgi:hypothetical protein